MLLVCNKCNLEHLWYVKCVSDLWTRWPSCVSVSIMNDNGRQNCYVAESRPLLRNWSCLCHYKISFLKKFVYSWVASTCSATEALGVHLLRPEDITEIDVVAVCLLCRGLLSLPNKLTLKYCTVGPFKRVCTRCRSEKSARRFPPRVLHVNLQSWLKIR
jgi:hypothetical protein